MRFVRWALTGWAIGLAFLLVFVAALFTGCATVPPVPPVPPPVGAPSCDTACARLEQLHCPAAKPTAAGAPCAEVCSNIEASGIVVYGVECVTEAPTCAKADACGGPAH